MPNLDLLCDIELDSTEARWRIQMSWPDRMPRLFGDFKSKAEAANWIREHSWLVPDKDESAEVADPGQR